MPASGRTPVLPALVRLKRYSRIFCRALEHRARLAALELDEAWDRATRVGILLAVGAATTTIAGTTVTILVAAIFWDTDYRVTALAILCAFWFAAVGCLAWMIRRQFENWSLLESTRTQLEADREIFAQVFASNDGDHENE